VPFLQHRTRDLERTLFRQTFLNDDLRAVCDDCNDSPRDNHTFLRLMRPAELTAGKRTCNGRAGRSRIADRA
jgi:hypothetical protein